VGADLLGHIVAEFLCHLDSSAAVYERDGTYALGIFSSGWCRSMDLASRRLCETEDNREALRSPEWHCHRSCWDVSKDSIDSGLPVDRPCLGGIRIYSEPIRCGNEIIGAINFGYGDPPADHSELSTIASRYRLPLADVKQLAARHESVPASVVELARSRLATAARLIGEIVARKRVERERAELEAKVRSRQKLESLGVLAGGIAHDFNNLLVGVIGNAELLADTMQEPQLKRCAEEILRAALAARTLSRKMLAYAGRSDAGCESIDLAGLVTDMAELVRASVGPAVGVRVDASHGLKPILADKAGLEQVLLNLAINGAEALDGRTGTLEIRVGTTQLDASWGGASGHVHGEPAPGPYQFLEVEDRGRGMSAAEVERIFEPFYSTKAVGRGLGMAAVLGIVRSHKGAIEIHTRPGTGTRVRVLFPDLQPENTQAAIAAPASVEPVAQSTVLLIDDETLVRSACERMLQHFGHNVLSAASGFAGIALFEDRSADIDAAIVDLSMPDCSGDVVVAALRELRPGLPVVLMTGYSDGELRLPPGVEFLPKPFQVDDLLGSLGRALASARR
jgi:signal transduction histidine kinase/CheY-like chemotaxis protein